MSNIIKGQRVRSESPLKIKHIDTYKPPEVKETVKTEPKINLTLDEINNAKEQARKIIRKAKEEKEAIINKAKQELEIEYVETVKKAKEEGYSKGYEEGYIKGQKEADAIIEEAKQELKSAKEEKKEILHNIEPEVLELILDITKKLISEEILYNKDTIILLIKKSLRNTEYDITDVTIKVSEEDYQYVIEKEEDITNHTNIQVINIQKDANLSKGSCIIETPFGSVKCDITKEFEEIKKQMRLICEKR